MSFINAGTTVYADVLEMRKLWAKEMAEFVSEDSFEDMMWARATLQGRGMAYEILFYFTIPFMFISDVML